MNLASKIIVSTLLASTAALANRGGPIVTKSSGGGYTPREWSNFETCEVFSNRIVVTHSFANGEIVAKEEHPISVGGTSNLYAVLGKAKLETLESTENNMCDAPGTEIFANEINPNDSITQVTIFSSGGCGSPRLERRGAYSHILRSLVELYCPKTHDIGGNN